MKKPKKKRSNKIRNLYKHNDKKVDCNNSDTKEYIQLREAAGLFHVNKITWACYYNSTLQ